MAANAEQRVRAALAYACRGWPVLPCQPDGKAPATRHGFRDASTDPEQILRWWRRQAAANVAITTGAPGPDVLDIDQRGQAGNGFAAYRRLKDAGLLDGAFAFVATPGRGLHAYFTGSRQPSGSLPGLHLDFKAAGGYVVAPPSSINGRRYRLLAQREPQDRGLDWMAAAALLEPGRQQARPRPAPWPGEGAPGGIDRLAGWVGQLREGNRNSGLFWAACRAVETGYDDSLDALAAAAASTGLGDHEIDRTIASARRAASPARAHLPEAEATR